ncbi:MAG TPA: hypothetical protein VK509_12185 [Polyangiales bacterium]|nr:hypothetical protein [Polyangiales bacterium]
MKRLILALGLLCACSKAREPETGSQTHFLNDCDVSCPAPYSCLCGVCTLACSDADQCSDAPGAAVCVAPESKAGSCSEAKLCDVECERNADCSAVGPQFSCEAGRCRETSTGTGGSGGSGGNAGGSAAGRGGQGGSGGSAQGGASGGTAQGGASGGSGQGGASGGSCNDSEDCVLIAKGCCAACVATKIDVEAVPSSRRAAETELNCPGGPPACGPCPPAAHDPEHAIVRAACVSGQCTVIDLREETETECSNDDDCNLAQQGCCGSCGGDPSGWLAVSSGTTDPYPLTCDPIPPCVPCSEPDMPEPFCAADGHCAVREIARVNGVPSTTCYSPTQNLERAYEAGAMGCDCAASGTSQCIRDSTGSDVALTCDMRWQAIQDGPCGV